MLDEGKNPQLQQRKKFFEKRRDILLDKNEKAKEVEKEKQTEKEKASKSVKFIEQKKPLGSSKQKRK